MPRIHPATETQSDPATQELLNAVRQQMGTVPNIVATMAHSRAALEAYLSMSGALNQGTISDKLQEQIALTVAGANRCDYCASAHSMVAGLLGIEKTEIASNLAGKASDDRAQAALGFANAIVAKGGNISDDELQAVIDSGYSSAEIVEIVANVALNIFTNYFNHVAETAIDFPHVSSHISAIS